MTHDFSWLAFGVFLVFLASTLGLSFYLGRRAGTTQGFFAAHGQIPWFVNGVAFAGDYLSAASFLGICGMIAFYGFDGFLYSIGYLAGWIVALFVIAEPIKRRGKFTFADCLDSTFDSRGIRLVAGTSALVVSTFYLIPQMVGAGALIQPLLGLPHWAGVVLVGTVVVLIVFTAGMVSTTWVQFLKGALLVLFSLMLTGGILWRGLAVAEGGIDGYRFTRLGPLLTPSSAAAWQDFSLDESPWGELKAANSLIDVYWPRQLVPFFDAQGVLHVFSLQPDADGLHRLEEAQTQLEPRGSPILWNGKPAAEGGKLHPVGTLRTLPANQQSTGPLDPLSFLRVFSQSQVVRWSSLALVHPDGTRATLYVQVPTRGDQMLRPGESPTFPGIRSDQWSDKLNFISLMLALFCGTASLPHILIRYYTVKDEIAARKSTIVGIATIGSFYVLTLYLGLGAMTSGALDVKDSNLAAPLLARSISEVLFALITAIAFTTVLGTVSGLILASAGAVAHDLVPGFGVRLSDAEQVRVAKLTAIGVGIAAMVLGILCARLNVNFLVGWAFSVAASANLPALVMLLFWRGTTRQGVIASVLVGMGTSLAWILVSGDTVSKVYGWSPDAAWVPFSQPGIVTIPLAFATLVIVSRLTRNRR